MSVVIGLEDGQGGVILGGDRAVIFGATVFTRPTPKFFMSASRLFVGVVGEPRIHAVLEEVDLLPGFDIQEAPLASHYFINHLAESLAEDLVKRNVSHIRDGKQETESEVLAVHRGHLYRIDCNFAVHEAMNGFMAIGAASELALGAMAALAHLAPMDRVRKALEICGQYNVLVRPPYDVLKIVENENGREITEG